MTRRACINAGTCLSPTSHCGCAEQDEQPTPIERIWYGLLIAVGSALVFFSLCAFIYWGLR